MSQNFGDTFNDEDSFLDAVFEKIIADQNSSTESSLFPSSLSKHPSATGEDIEAGYPVPLHISVNEVGTYNMEKKEPRKLDADSPEIQRTQSENVPQSSVDRVPRRILSVPGAFRVEGPGHITSEESAESRDSNQNEGQHSNDDYSEILLDAQLVDDDIESSRRNSVLTVQASVVKESTPEDDDISFRHLFLKNRRFQIIFVLLMMIVVGLTVGVIYGSRTSGGEMFGSGDAPSADTARPSNIINHTPVFPQEPEIKDDASEEGSQAMKPSPGFDVDSSGAPSSAPTEQGDNGYSSD